MIKRLGSGTMTRMVLKQNIIVTHVGNASAEDPPTRHHVTKGFLVRHQVSQSAIIKSSWLKERSLKDLRLVAEEAGDDDLGDVGGVRTAAGHTHHSEEDGQREKRANSKTRVCKQLLIEEGEGQGQRHKDRRRSRGLFFFFSFYFSCLC